MSRLQRIELLLFAACFFTYAYFNQGGGWNQNSRFAEIRAMVEEGRFDIDDYLVYQRDPETGDLLRAPLQGAEYTLHGKRYRLCWVDMEWNFFPVGDAPLRTGTEKAAMVEVCASGDIGYVPWTGHFHPNKPPGTSFLALPAYFLIYHVEKWLGLNPDHWWTLEWNAWAVTACSVSLLSALGCVLFFRIARSLAPGSLLPPALATLAFAFGTTFLPFGTILFDHDLTAVLLVASFYFLRPRPSKEAPGSSPRLCEPGYRYAVAGLCAGMAALTNYLAAPAGVFLGIYALCASRPRTWHWRAAVLFVLGVAPPFLLICWYGCACFGSPFHVNNEFQNPLFQDTGGAWLGMFPVPRSAADFFRLLYVTELLTISPIRGLFFLCPVLLLGAVGLWQLLRRAAVRADALLCAAIFGFFFVVNIFFNGYHGGFSAGPRYLVPGLPFLALPLVVAFTRWRRLTVALAAVSIAINLLLTAVDAQNPVGIGGHARIEFPAGQGEGIWTYNIVGQYAWPLFVSNRAWPLLQRQMQQYLERERLRIDAETADPRERSRRLEELRSDLFASIDRGEPSPFLLGSVEGPVSVNPIGVYEGLFTYGLFPPGSPQCRWASYNLGELLWPQSRLSLLPLLLVGGGLCAWLLRLAAGSVNGERAILAPAASADS